MNDAGTTVRRDFLLAACATALVAVISIRFELSEALQGWTVHWEKYQFDELPGIALFAALALAWFVLRRVREARKELARRIALERELATALAENRRLSQEQVRIQEEERRRLARELHDELGQHLNAVKLDAVSIRDCAERRLPEAHRAAVSIIGIADHLHALVRDMTRRLRPAGLDELGLPAALESFTESWRSRHADVELELAVSGEFAGLSELANITLYRLVQEGLTNVARHAEARRVEIRVSRTRGASDDDGVTLELKDDGRGARGERNSRGLGLVGMRERIEALGGRLEIVTQPARGFHVSAWLPLQAAP